MVGKLSIGEAWSEAAAFLRKERRLLAPVVLGLLLLPALISTMVQPPTPAGTSPEAGPWMVVAFAMVVVMLLGQLAIIVLIDGWKGSVGDAIGRAARRLPTMLLATLAIMIPLILSFAILLAGVTLAAGGGGDPTMAKMGPAGALAALLFAIPALYFLVRLLPLAPVIATGSDGPLAAIKRSFALTRGRFWKLLGFLLLWLIAFLVAAAAVGAVFGSMVILALGRPDPWSVSLLIIALVGALVQALFVTVYTAMLARITAQLEGSTSGT